MQVTIYIKHCKSNSNAIEWQHVGECVQGTTSDGVGTKESKVIGKAQATTCHAYKDHFWAQATKVVLIH